MPIVGINVAANLETTASKSIFMDIPKDGSLRGRLAPAMEGSNGAIAFFVMNHFRLKAEDGERNIAVACNQIHNDDEKDCLLCTVQRHLMDSDDKAEKTLGKGRESIRANGSWYYQFFPYIKGSGDEYGAPKLIRLPRTGAEGINEILVMQQEAGEPFLTDVEKGRDVVIKRTDTGVAFTKYSVLASGANSALAEIVPDWEDKILSYEQVWKKLDLRILTNDEQEEVLRRSYPSLDWTGILEEVV